MSRREEIQRRANEEFNEVLARCDAIRAELVSQQRAALAAAPAYAEYERAIAAAYDAYRIEIAVSEEELVELESEAIGSQQFTDAEAATAWQAATEHATSVRAAALAKTLTDYNEAYNTASRLTGTARDMAMAAARRAHEQTVNTAEAAYLQSTDAAWRAFVAASDRAREGAIHAIEKAREKQRVSVEKAARTHETAQERARVALNRAIADDPSMRTINGAFEERLAEAQRRCEAEKADVLARMRRDLAAASA
jgi:hypothetical protein